MKTVVFATIVAAAAAVPAFAQTPAGAYGADASAQAAPTTRSCFRMSQIRNHRFSDPSTMYLRVGVKDFYKVQTSGTCAVGGIRDNTIITSTASGTDLVCRPIDLNLKVRSSGGGIVTPCIVSSIAPMTPAEVAALPPKVKP